MNQIVKFYTWDEWPIKDIADILKISEQRVISTLRAHGIEIPTKRTHNYPKTRKKGVYKKSQKYDLLQRHPESHIERIWKQHGIYKAGEILDASPGVLWHLAREKGWKRPLPAFLALAAQMGNWKITENYYIDEKDK